MTEQKSNIELIDLEINLSRDEYMRIQNAYDNLYNKLSYGIALNSAFILYSFTVLFQRTNNFYGIIIMLFAIVSFLYAFYLLVSASFGSDVSVVKLNDSETNENDIEETKIKVLSLYKEIINDVSKLIELKQTAFEHALICFLTGFIFLLGYIFIDFIFLKGVCYGN